MAEQPNSLGTPSVNKKNRRRSNKQKAEDQFDITAKPKSLEKFFSEVIEEQRENVDIELHLDIDERLTDGYVDRIESFIEFSNIESDSQNQVADDKIADLNAITNVSIAKKLWTSTPESEKTAIEPMKYLRTMDVQVPKAINIAVDQLGKVTDEEWICRIKYNSLTIERFLFRSMQQAAHDTKFFSRHLESYFEDEEETKKFMNQDVGKLFTTSLDSIDFLRDYAEIALKTIMSKTFEVKIGQNNDIIKVSYPQMTFGKNEDDDRKIILDWMSKLSVNHPDWEIAADAAILRLVNLPWLKKKSTPLKDLDPIFAEGIWKNRTMNDVFHSLHLQHLEDFKKLKIRNAVSDFLFWYQKMSVPLFKRMFNLTTMSMASAFGSKAQLIVMSNFTETKKVTGTFQSVSNGAEGSSYFRLKDKGSIVQNMIYGFTRAINIHENYKYRTNGSPNSIKASNISSDLKE